MDPSVQTTMLCLLLLLLANCAFSSSNEPGIERLLQDNIRRTSAISENIMAMLEKVGKLDKEANVASGRLKKLLSEGELMGNTTVHVSNGVSKILDELRILDSILATSEDNNATLRNIEDNVKEMRSVVNGISKTCQSENAQGFKELSVSVPEKLEGIVKRYCDDVTSKVESLVKRTSSCKTEEATVKPNEKQSQELAGDIRDIAAVLAEFKTDTSQKLKDLQISLESVRKEGLAWKQYVDNAVQRVISAMRRKRVVWYLEGVGLANKLLTAFPVSNNTQHTISASRPFTVGGYTARLGVQVSASAEGSPWLGVAFSLCPGDQDSFLQWPFATPFTLSFLHPTDSSKNMRYDVLLKDLTGRFHHAVRRPIGKCNEKWIAFPRVVEADTMLKEGFALNDGLSVAVDLYPTV